MFVFVTLSIITKQLRRKQNRAKLQKINTSIKRPSITVCLHFKTLVKYCLSSPDTYVCPLTFFKSATFALGGRNFGKLATLTLWPRKLAPQRSQTSRKSSGWWLALCSLRSFRVAALKSLHKWQANSLLPA